LGDIRALNSASEEGEARIRRKGRPMSKEEPSSSFTKLLVAIDGSEISDYALNFAIHIGEAFSSRVDLIYVESSPIHGAIAAPVLDPTPGGQLLGPSSVVTVSQKDLQRNISKNQALVSERKKLVDGAGLTCDAITVQSDDVGGEIVKLAGSSDYNLVVMGSRGLSGLKSLILGSVSRKVARESKTSVLIVKNKVERLPKILVGYDGSKEARLALLAAAHLAVKFQGEVDPLGVISIPMSSEGMLIPDSISKWEKEMADYVREAVRTLQEQGVAKCNGKTIDSPDIARGIVDEAEAGSYDLVVVGMGNYSKLKSFFLGNVASGVADNAKTNVLIVR
jgi:nucleotide-binding universal stress UspA family protein